MRTTIGRRTLCAPVLVAALLAPLLALAVAAAHARYDHSTPKQGEVVATSPARVDIFTAQEMKKEQATTAITVADASSARVDNDDTTVDDADRKHFSVGLKPNLPAGRYVVSFKNVSDEDGEADNGQFAFYVGAGPTAAQTALDATLKITAKTDEVKHSNSHTGLIVAIIIIVVAVIVVAGGGFTLLRRRRRI